MQDDRQNQDVEVEDTSNDAELQHETKEVDSEQLEEGYPTAGEVISDSDDSDTSTNLDEDDSDDSSFETDDDDDDE